MSSSPSSFDLLRVSSFLGDAPKSELVALLAQCGEQHAGDLPAVRKAAVFYGLTQPNRAAAALAAHTRGQDPPLGVVRSDAERELLVQTDNATCVSSVLVRGVIVDYHIAYPINLGYIHVARSK